MIPVKIGMKTIVIISEEQGLNNIMDRPACNIPACPLMSALQIREDAVCNKLSINAIGYLLANANDVQQASQLTALFSSIYNGGHGWSVESCNWDKTAVVWAVRKLVVPTWLNNKDQFRQSNISLPDDFITDCATWCLFHGSNQTSSLKDVEYKGQIWQVRNQFFPYQVEWLRCLDSVPQEVFSQLRNAQDTFVAQWLAGRILSPEAKTLLDAGGYVYKKFYREYANLNRVKFKLAYWDVGWLQIHHSLNGANLGSTELQAVKDAHTVLRDKLRPKIYEYGFLSHEMMYE